MGLGMTGCGRSVGFDRGGTGTRMQCLCNPLRSVTLVPTAENQEIRPNQGGNPEYR